MLYKLFGGNHVLDGRTYKNGDVIKTNLELDKIFALSKKFQRIHSPDVAGANPAPPQSSIDVTTLLQDNQKYALAEKGLQLVQKGSWYDVVDMITGKKLNEKSLRHAEIDKFIQQYMEPDAMVPGQGVA